MSFVPLRRKLTVGGEGRLRGEVGSRAWRSMKGAKAWNRKKHAHPPSCEKHGGARGVLCALLRRNVQGWLPCADRLTVGPLYYRKKKAEQRCS